MNYSYGIYREVEKDGCKKLERIDFLSVRDADAENKISKMNVSRQFPCPLNNSIICVVVSN